MSSRTSAGQPDRSEERNTIPRTSSRSDGTALDRSGVAGKGFAVVAEEVRNLAMRSAKAARNTSELIESSRQRAERGVTSNAEVSQNLSEIAGGIQRLSAVMRKFVIKALELCGYPLGSISQAANGAEALALLETEWIDLAVVDVNMPVMNGEEFLCRVRADPVHRDLPIVIVSTEGSETRIDRLKNRNAGFLRKPFTPVSLRNAIAEQIGEPHASGTGNEAVPSSGPDF